MCRVGQIRVYTPYMTVYLAISLPKKPYIHRIYMVLVNPSHVLCFCHQRSPCASLVRQTDECFRMRLMCASEW